MQLTPNKTDFLRLAAEHSLIPVHVDLPVDLETPVSLYYKIVGDEPGFMLESAETSKNFGRYSFIGVEPFLVIEAHKAGLELKSAAGTESIKKAPMNALQDILNRFSFADHSSAGQGPRARRKRSLAGGQVSSAQHTPQPLHGAPASGLRGAAWCRWMICSCMQVNEPFCWPRIEAWRVNQ